MVAAENRAELCPAFLPSFPWQEQLQSVRQSLGLDSSAVIKSRTGPSGDSGTNLAWPANLPDGERKAE